MATGISCAEVLSRIAGNWAEQRYMLTYQAGAVSTRRGPFTAEQVRATAITADTLSGGTVQFWLDPTDEGLGA